MVAASLPHNANEHNAFRNSFHWDAAERVLYVRRQRLRRVGDLVVVLAHTLAHVRANPRDLSNDADPTFYREFYGVLRACGQALFQRKGEASAAAGPSGAAAAGASAAGAGAAAAAAGSSLGGPTPPAPAYFSETQLQSRLNKYMQLAGVSHGRRGSAGSFLAVTRAAGSFLARLRRGSSTAGGSMMLKRMSSMQPTAQNVETLERQVAALQERVDVADRLYMEEMKTARELEDNVQRLREGLDDAARSSGHESEEAQQAREELEEASAEHAQALQSMQQTNSKLEELRSALRRKEALLEQMRDEVEE
mmetsp:Transcript_29624/g.96795  ORF Transcript_29624/g.96795 Transcript_29624/m.96795 type:complete len:308 (+) Transcript_29624:937-1860(+)